jgi:hypothetical protein
MLTAKDIAQIIKACKNAGVKELKLADFSLTFGNEPASSPESESISEEPISADVLEAQIRQEKEDIEMQEATAKQLSLDALMIEEPAEYERLIAEGELKDAEIQH